MSSLAGGALAQQRSTGRMGGRPSRGATAAAPARSTSSIQLLRNTTAPAATCSAAVCHAALTSSSAMGAAAAPAVTAADPTFKPATRTCFSGSYTRTGARSSTVCVAAAAVGLAEQEQEEEEVDRMLQVKLGLAETTGRLDLTDCRLTKLPKAVLELKELEVSDLCGRCPLKSL